MITSDQLKDAQDRVAALNRYLDIDAKTMQAAFTLRTLYFFFSVPL